MKVLVAYVGSGCAQAAIDDLARAGLPEAVVISVAEVWLPPANGHVNGSITALKLSPVAERLIKRLYDKNEHLVAEAGTLANYTKQRLIDSCLNLANRSVIKQNSIVSLPSQGRFKTDSRKS